MGPLLVVSGPPGVGKSTVARTLADRWSPSALVEGDEFHRFVRNGAIEPWRPEAHEQNRRLTSIQGATCERYRGAGYETVFDGVLGPWFLDRFAEEVDPPFDYVVLLPPAVDLRGRDRVVDNSVGSPDDAADRVEELRASGRLLVG